MNPVTAITTSLRKSFTYRGRASRSEFWWFQALRVIVAVAFLVVLGLFLENWDTQSLTLSEYDSALVALSDNRIALLITTALVLVLLPASYASSVRRLHDRGHPGWPLWLVMVAAFSQFYIFLILIFYAALDPQGTVAWVEVTLLRIDDYFTSIEEFETYMGSTDAMIWSNVIYFFGSIVIGSMMIAPFYFIFFSIQACLPSIPKETKHGPAPNTLSQYEVFQ